MATFDAVANFAYGSLVAAPVPALTGTSLTLNPGEGALFPATPFNAVLCPPQVNPTFGNAEIVRVTNITGDTLTIVRAQEGTTAKPIAVGWVCAQPPTKKWADDVTAAIAALPQSAIQSVSAGTQNFTGPQIVFSNSNGVSFGLDAGTLTAAHNGLTSQSNQAFSADGGSSAFQTLGFSNGNGVSFSNSNGSVVGSVRTDYAGTGFTSAGANISMSGTNNANGLSLSLSVAAPVTTAGLISAVNFSAGTTSNNMSALTFANSNGVSFGLDGSVVTATVATNYQSQGAYLTTAMASNRGSDFVQATAAFAGTNASGTINSAGVSVSVNAQSVQPVAASGSNGSFNFSTLQFVTGNGASFYTDATGIRLSYTVPTQSVQPVAASASNGSFLFSTLGFSNANGVTFGTSAGSIVTASVNAGGGGAAISAGANSQSTGTVNFANSNGITFGLSNNGTMTASYTVPSIAGLISAINVSAGTTSNNMSAITFSNGSGVSFGLNGSVVTATVQTNYLTTAMLSNAATISNINLSAGTTSLNASAFTFANSNGVSFGLSGNSVITATVKTDYLTTAMASNRGSDFVAATAAFAGTNASGTIASNGISVSVNAGGGAAIRGIAANGSTATENTVNFSNANGVSFGFGAAGNSTVMTASHNGLTTARASNDGLGLATAQTNATWTANSAGLSFDAAGYAGTTTGFTGANLSASMTHNSLGLALSMSAAAPGGGAAQTLSYIEIMDGARLTTCCLWNNATYSQRPIFVPFWLGGVIASVKTIAFLFSRTGGTSLAATFRAGIYSFANATSINLISSTSFNVSLTTSAQFSGIRGYQFTGLGAMSLSPGLYVLGLQASPVGSASLGLNIMGGDQFAFAGYVNSGTNATAATNSGSHMLPFWGVWNATSNALPAAVGTASVSGGNPVNSPDIYAVIRAI